VVTSTAASPAPPPRRALRFAVRIAIALPLALVLLAVSLAFYRPSWYRSQSTRPADPQAVRDDLRDAAQGFSDALMQPGIFDVHLRENQLVQWIAMRAEIFPLIERRIPREWSDPTIRFRDGVIRLAATYRGGGPNVVISIDLDVAVDSDEICLKVVRCRAGALPLPIAIFARNLSAPIDIAPDKAWRGSPRMLGDLLDGLHVDARAVWPNGQRLYAVLGITVRRDTLDLKIESLGPARQSRRKTHSDGLPNPFADNP